MQVGNVYKNSNYKIIQVLSHIISSHNFKLFIPSMFELKAPCLKSKTSCLELTLSWNQKFHAWGFEIMGSKKRKENHPMLLEYILG